MWSGLGEEADPHQSRRFFLVLSGSVFLVDGVPCSHQGAVGGMLDCLFYSWVTGSLLKILVQTPFQEKFPWKCCSDLVRRTTHLWAFLPETGVFLWWFTELTSFKSYNDNCKKNQSERVNLGKKVLCHLVFFRLIFLNLPCF